MQRLPRPRPLRSKRRSASRCNAALCCSISIEPPGQQQGLRGYIVEREGGGYVVTFYGGTEEAPVAAYRGRVESHRVVSQQIFSAAARPPLTPVQRRLVAARQAAVTATRRRPCGTAPFNSAVIPPDSPDDPIDVYLLTPQVADREYPLGGHFRATVGSDGSILAERPFTNSCLTMAQPAGAVAMGVSHLLDPVPTEIHVFTSLASGVPVYVGTIDPDRAWEVGSGRIRLMEDQPRRRRRGR